MCDCLTQENCPAKPPTASDIVSRGDSGSIWSYLTRYLPSVCFSPGIFSVPTIGPLDLHRPRCTTMALTSSYVRICLVDLACRYCCGAMRSLFCKSLAVSPSAPCSTVPWLSSGEVRIPNTRSRNRRLPTYTCHAHVEPRDRSSRSCRAIGIRSPCFQHQSCLVRFYGQTECLRASSVAVLFTAQCQELHRLILIFTVHEARHDFVKLASPCWEQRLFALNLTWHGPLAISCGK